MEALLAASTYTPWSALALPGATVLISAPASITASVVEVIRHTPMAPATAPVPPAAPAITIWVISSPDCACTITPCAVCVLKLPPVAVPVRMPATPLLATPPPPSASTLVEIPTVASVVLLSTITPTDAPMPNSPPTPTAPEISSTCVVSVAITHTSPTAEITALLPMAASVVLLTVSTSITAPPPTVPPTATPMPTWTTVSVAVAMTAISFCAATLAPSPMVALVVLVMVFTPIDGAAAALPPIARPILSDML